MKIYKTQKEIENDIVDGVLKIDGDVKFEVSFKIGARIIVAGNINAKDVLFWAIACAYVSFKCKSIKGRRDNAKYICLDKEVEIMPETKNPKEIEINGATYVLKQ